MHVFAALHPLEQRRVAIAIVPGMTLTAIARQSIADWCAAYDEDVQHYDWFFEHGVMRVDGKAYERALWPHIQPKSHTVVDLCVTVNKGSAGRVLLVLAAVALTVGTGFIASGGLAGVLGAGFGAGTLGANLAAGALGLVGSLAINALTPVPSIPTPEAAKEIQYAGISNNQVAIGETLLCVVGRMRVSPQSLIPAFRERIGERFYINAMVGCHGRNLIEDILVDGTPIAEISGATWESREGYVGEANPDTFLSNQTVISTGNQIKLTQHDLLSDANKETNLRDQTTPDKSLPSFHLLNFKAGATRFSIRMEMPSGISDGSNLRHAIPVRVEMKLKGTSTWRNLPSLHLQGNKKIGRQFADIDIYFSSKNGVWRSETLDRPFYMALNRTGSGQPHEYLSDAYFNAEAQTATIPPALTSNTTPAPYVVSASINNSTAWTAFSANAAAWSVPNANLGTAELVIDMGSNKTVGSYTLISQSSQSTNPKTWRIFGRLLATDPWTLIDNGSQTLEPWDYGMQRNLDSKYTFRYFRLIVDSNFGGATTEVSFFTFYGNYSIAEHTTATGSNHVNTTPAGVEIYLEPASWPAGEYDVRIKRGWAFVRDSLDVSFDGTAYIYGTAQDSNFFGYKVVSGVSLIPFKQDNIQSEAVVLEGMSFFPVRPIRADIEEKLTRIAVRIPDRQVQSISALLTAYGPQWNGTAWTAEVPTRNPASHYRNALLQGTKNATPLEQGLLFENSVEGYFTHSAANAIYCDAILQGRNVHDVLVLLAAVGRASPRQSNMWGLTIDHDRSGETPVGMITPETSRDRGTTINFEDLPHGLRLSYFDEADDYKQKNVMVYRAGYNSSNATLIEGMPNYDGIVTEAAAISQGTYDLRQLIYRRASFSREVGIEAMSYARGDLLGLVDEVVQRDVFYGLVRQILVIGGNVTGFVIYNDVKLTGVTAPSGFGIMVRKASGGVHVAAIVETADTNRVTLVTPIADTGQFDTLHPISVGPLGKQSCRVVLNRITPQGGDVYELQLLPEGNGIFAS